MHLVLLKLVKKALLNSTYCI